MPIELYWADTETPEKETERSAIPLAHYLWVLRRHMRKIAGLVLAAVVCVYVLTKRITPIYESTVTIGIDRFGASAPGAELMDRTPPAQW